MLSPSFSFPAPVHFEISVEPEHVNKGSGNRGREECAVLCPISLVPGLHAAGNWNADGSKQQLQERCQLLQQGAVPAIDPALGVTSLHRRPGPDSHQRDTFDNKVAYVRWFKRSLLLIC